MFGLVTIDVEPDDVWRKPRSRSLDNIGQLPRFHDLCRDHGVRPTYLVTWSVAEDPASAAVIEALLATGDCEVGMHPHMWEIPPLIAKDRVAHAWVAGEYETAVLEEKLTNLHGLLSRRFGQITSHRAGRWALETRQVAILERLGIIVDSSVVPGADMRSTGAPDYSNAPLAPYRLALDDLCAPGCSGVLEVPCTVKKAIVEKGWAESRYAKAVLRRLRLDAQWLRAAPSSSHQSLARICEWAAGRLASLNMMSHSSEFLAGASPSWPAQSDIEHHFALYRAVFSWWNRHGIRPCTLSEFAGQAELACER